MKKLVSVLIAAALIVSSSVAMAEPVKLVFWDMIWGSAGVYDKAGQALVDEFNQSQSDIQVEYQSVPWDNYYQVFLTAITSGSGPDVATAGSQTPMQFASMNEIQPLDGLIEKWKAENDPILDDFLPGFLETNLLDGKTIALPWNADTRVFTYRTDLFEQAGITELPTDWDSLREVLRKLKAAFPDTIPLVSAGDSGGSQNLMMWLTIANNIGPITQDYKPNMTAPEMRQCLEYMASLMDEGLIPEATVSYKAADADRLFMSGSAAMIYGGPNKIYWSEDAIKDKISILDPMKGPSAEKPQTVYWANSIASYTKKYPGEAEVFIEWWVKHCIKLYTDGQVGKVPVLQSQLADPFFTESVLDRALTEKIAPTFVHATFPVKNFYPAFGQINGERYLSAALQEVLTGRRDFDAILEEQDVNVANALELQQQ